MDRIEAAKQRGIEDKASGTSSRGNPFNNTYAPDEHRAWQEGYETPQPIGRFMVFAWTHRDAAGGMHDLEYSGNDIMQALGIAKSLVDTRTFVEIYDITTGAMIFDSQDQDAWIEHSKNYESTATARAAAVEAYREVSEL